MKISINNFIIPYFIIKSICRDVGCYPMDVSVEFSSVPKSETSPVAFSVLESFSRKQVNLIVLSKYLENFENIHGISIDLSTIQGALSTCAFMCDIYFDQSIYEIPKTECENSNFPFVFIATKNIIYPYFNLDLRKENIVCDPSALYDFVISDSSINFGIKNLKAEYRDAFVLMGIDCLYRKINNQDSGFIYKSLNSPDVMRMLFSFSVTYFNNSQEKADLFFGLLQMYSDSIASRQWFESKFSNLKTARADMDGNFWIYGLIEKMLAPARGPDFTVTKKWAPITNEIWLNIEDARKKAGLTGASLEFMLKIKDHGVSDDTKPIQALIEEMRS